MPKVFAGNPLALSVPDPVFETWLRDSGYLEVLDERTATAAIDPSPPPPASTTAAALLRSSTTAAAPSTTAASAAAAASASIPSHTSSGGVRSFWRLFSLIRTLVAVLTLNPFAKLTSYDTSVPTPSWTLEFIGDIDSYSWPAGPSQLRMRAQENVRRYARNYAALAVIFFACALYQKPIALAGLISSLAIWELMRFHRGGSDLERRFPIFGQIKAWGAQISTVTIIYLCNVHVALIYAISVGYAVMILHASLRKLAPSKQNQQKRSWEKKLLFAAK